MAGHEQSVVSDGDLCKHSVWVPSREYGNLILTYSRYIHMHLYF